MNPIPSATSRLNKTPTQMFRLSWKVSRAAANAAVTTDTPEDRSNSPPIISRATPTATIPMVEEAYSTVENEGSVRNGGAMAKKKMKIAIAAATAPISGRVAKREANVRLTGAGVSDAFGGVVTGELMSAPGVGGPGRGRARARGAAPTG